MAEKNYSSSEDEGEAVKIRAIKEAEVPPSHGIHQPWAQPWVTPDEPHAWTLMLTSPEPHVWTLMLTSPEPHVWTLMLTSPGP